jgi:lysylphosphatidylglycerol synthetase-like protein (DUF2156 family)
LLNTNRRTTSNTTTPIIIIISIMLIVAFHLATISNVQLVFASAGDDRENIADVFVFSSGIFAGILLALSLIAYRNLKEKRLLFVSAAFGIFALYSIVSKLDLFTQLQLESSVLNLILAVMNFLALAFFFLAIVRYEKSKIKTLAPE